MQIITALSKKLVPKFESIRDASDRIKLVLEELDYENFVQDLGLESEEKDYPRKNVQVNLITYKINLYFLKVKSLRLWWEPRAKKAKLIDEPY